MENFNYYLTVSEYGVGLVGHSGGPREDAVAVVIEEVPTGEWSQWRPFGDVMKRTCNMIRVFKFIKPANIKSRCGYVPNGEYSVGDIVSVMVENYYAEYDASAIGANDFCTYCGTDNGPGGTYRQGYDCYACGGN